MGSGSSSASSSSGGGRNGYNNSDQPGNYYYFFDPGWRLSYRNNPHNRGRAHPTENEVRPAPDPRPPPPPEATSQKPLTVTSVNLNLEANTTEHKTQLYDVTKAKHGDNAQLVVRRGDPFDIDVTFDRPMEDDKDKLQFVFQIGPSPRAGNETEHSARVKAGLKAGEFGAEVTGKDGNKVMVSLQTATTAVVGRWKITIRTSRAADNSSSNSGRPVPAHSNTYTLQTPVTVLFNVWNQDDEVFMAEEVERDEYVLNPAGKIWVGSTFYIRERPWMFGQFEKDILECSLYLLELGGLATHARGDVQAVTRKLAAVVNSSDESGVLIGNWSGEYDGGASPTSWQGSVKILQQFYKSKSPVKFGQCWVFAGVLTTVSRALGIPSRCVTNFNSAHDSDGTCTIDTYLDEQGEEIERRNIDSIWNFHVWCEAYMTRPDLIDPQFGGWQAYDATPQETSAGIYTCGPCSVQAIKLGNVGLLYDGRFVFGEVNADKVTWVQELDEDGLPTFVAPDDLNGHRDQTRGIGIDMSTKRPRNDPEAPDERLDVTGNYKHLEGSKEEREAVARARLKCKFKLPYAASRRSQDVTFVTEELKHIMCGHDLVFKLKLANRDTGDEREVRVTMRMESVYNTGIRREKVAEIKETKKLGAGEEGEVVLTVEEAKVSASLAETRDQPNYRLYINAHVKPTSQIWYHEDIFVLHPSQGLKIEGASEMKAGQEYEIKCEFVNPLPRPLTGCRWQVEAPALQSVPDIKQSDVAAYGIAEVKVKVTFESAPGPTQILVQFDCNQLPEVDAIHPVTVTQ